MYCLRVFIVCTRTTLFIINVYHDYISVFIEIYVCIPSFTSIGWCISELYAHLYPYHNVWPEAVYCCFTRTTMFTMLFTC